MLKIPEGVPKDLVQQLEGFQAQIRILLCNYKILQDRLAKSPKDAIIAGQIKQVEAYIIEYNDKQAPVISKIRECIKLLGSSPSPGKSSDDDGSKPDDERANSEDDVLEALGLRDAPRLPNGKLDHTKLSMKDRMAIVRGMRKRRRKMPGSSPVNPGKKNLTPTRTPSPELARNPANGPDVKAESVDGVGARADRYNGYVEEYQRASIEPPTPSVAQPLDLNSAFPRVETWLNKCSKLQFLHNLDLFTPSDIESMVEAMQADGKEKILYRNLTYVPEMTDKRQKLAYNYLAPDLCSPPLLRTRQRRPPQSMPGLFSTSISRTNSRSTSNSRATTPDRITKSVSSSGDLEEAAEKAGKAEDKPKKEDPDKAKKAHRKSLEIELVGLEQRSNELNSTMNAGKRTISTRKERSRLSDVNHEMKQLKSRIGQLKKRLSSWK